MTSVRATDDKCTTGEEALFNRRWGGLEDGCVVDKVTGTYYRDFQWHTWESREITVMTRGDYEELMYQRSSSGSSSSSSSSSTWTKSDAKRKEPCSPIQSRPAEDQDEFWDFRFCATRGSTTFKSATRMQESTRPGVDYECPSGKVACSSATDFQNTICMKQADKDAGKCPITGFNIVPQTGNTKSTLQSQGWTVTDLKDDYYLLVSKTVGNNLPLTNFNLEDTPCLDSRDVSLSVGQKFYPTELDRLSVTGCREIDQFNARFDTRYTSMSSSISEEDLQDESGVLDILEAQPYVNNYVQIYNKKNILYKFWSRPAISWDLECEVDPTYPTTRSDVIVAAQEEDKIEPISASTANVLAGIAYGFGLFFAIGMFCAFMCGCMRADKEWGDSKLKLGTTICLLIQAGMFVGSYFVVAGLTDDLETRKTSITNLTLVNPCGDDFTQIPANFLPEIEEANKSIGTCKMLCIVMVLVSVLSAVLCACARRHKDSDDGHDADDGYNKVDSDPEARYYNDA